ncbi:hypothetical protein Sango_1738000 [Sesamum angolense]|uniref:Uncharacterized protein n=1 Tax=Sesamum angolense TaxID=2727404 RepID=A0AAE2BS62_9LAMI|nr:hypothetical protein Sango_1738000 [Sesamum angolense]
MFMNAWATTCRKGCLQASNIHPCFDLTCRFPPLDPLTFSSKPQAPPHSEDIGKVVTKRFVFDKEVLSKLKKVGASAEVTNPTRIEAITAFLWRNLMIAFRQDAKRERKVIKFIACHAVNVRSRVSPHLPAHSFGNGTLSATAWSSKKLDNKDEDEHDSYAVLVAKLRNAIRGINHDYVEKMLDGERNGCMENTVVIKLIMMCGWRFTYFRVGVGLECTGWAMDGASPFGYRRLVCLSRM